MSSIIKYKIENHRCYQAYRLKYVILFRRLSLSVKCTNLAADYAEISADKQYHRASTVGHRQSLIITVTGSHQPTTFNVQQ